ncbi:MAG: hypothetical protein ACO3JV_12660 [Pseudomonadales bacterium]
MPPRVMVTPVKRIRFPAVLENSRSLTKLGLDAPLAWLVLGSFVSGCTTLSEPAAFNPNQTGFASCQFAAEAHPAPFNRDDITYGESVRSRTGMTEAMRECYERLDKIKDEAADAN